MIAFQDVNGVALDGNDDGTNGDNYVTTFTVAASTAVVVSVPNFARGPDSADAINVPNTSTSGIPIALISPLCPASSSFLRIGTSVSLRATSILTRAARNRSIVAATIERLTP